MASTISANVNWVDDVCAANLGTIAKINNTLYAIGGSLTLRNPSDPNSPGTVLANSQLFTIPFEPTSGNSAIDITTLNITSTRLPDTVPRTMWGNFFSNPIQQTLHLFGGLQIPQPIFLPNGTWDLRPRTPIDDNLFNYNLSSQTWSHSASTHLYNTSFGQAAKTQSYTSPPSAYLFGGALWSEYYTIGNNTKSGTPSNSFTEQHDLLQWSPITPSTPISKLNTTTAQTATSPRYPVQATLVHIPTLGSSGALVLLAGSLQGNYAPLKTIHIYDLSTHTWFAQDTSPANSSYPDARTEACAVAASAQDGSSSNIYLYGGKIKSGTGDTATYPPVSGEVWVLSLPSFTWIRSGSDETRTRMGHSCVRMHERYLVSYRGLGKAACDVNRGVEVFDVSDMQWVTSLDTGKGYLVPEVVSKVVGGSGSGGATKVVPDGGFADERIRALFSYTPNNSTNVKLSPPGDSGGGDSGKTAVKIAVPVVLVVVLGIALAVFWFCRRRRRDTAAAEIDEGRTRVELPHSGEPLMEYYSGGKGAAPGELESNVPPAYELPVPVHDGSAVGNKSHVAEAGGTEIQGRDERGRGGESEMSERDRGQYNA